MKTLIFTRPNLKVLLLGGLALVSVLHFFGMAQAEEDPMLLSSGPRSLEQLVERSYREPTEEVYGAIADAHRRQGNWREAMFYLRKAQLAAGSEDR